MSAMPPNMFEYGKAFEPSEVEAVEEEEYAPIEEHEHGPDCGHEAVQHGDHVDYVQEGRRHWWNRDHWDKH